MKLFSVDIPNFTPSPYYYKRRLDETSQRIAELHRQQDEVCRISTKEARSALELHLNRLRLLGDSGEDPVCCILRKLIKREDYDKQIAEQMEIYEDRLNEFKEAKGW